MEMREVSPGWAAHPNLQLRPHSPNKGRGRLQVQIRRAFVGHRLLSSSQVYDWCFPRHRAYRRPMSEAVRWSVHRILRQIAEPICKVPPHNAWLWRLKPGTENMLGYARVSTRDQNLAGQVAELTAAGCAKVYREKISGAQTDRAELGKVIGRLSPGTYWW
jgi:hypothetical protein